REPYTSLAVARGRLAASHTSPKRAFSHRMRLLQQAAAYLNPGVSEWHGMALLAVVSMYVAVGLKLRAKWGVRLRTSVLLLMADLGFRLLNGTSAAVMFLPSRILAWLVITIAAFFILGEAAVAIQAMRSWHATVVRERRRGGPLMMVQESGGQTVSRLAAGGAYTHRICFLCLSGHCERCLLSIEIWPTTSSRGSASDHSPLALPPLESPASNEQPAPEATHASETLSFLPARPMAPVLAAGRRRVRKHGRSTTASSPVAAIAAAAAELATLNNGPLLLGDTPSTQEAANGNGRGPSINMWIISSVAHCPCRLVHGPGPSAFVSKSQDNANDESTGSQPTMPVGSMMGLEQYVAELRSLGLVRPVNPASVSQSDDIASSVLPYIFGRFAVPAHQGLASATDNALAASNLRASGHTPASAPVFAAAPTVATEGAAEQSRVSRILMTSTPLSLARNVESSGTFHLSAVSVLESAPSDGGYVVVSIVMTPALAHMLLSHPHTAPTAAVCVPAALLSSTKTANSQMVILDADPYLDYALVHVPHSDIVVNVNGASWSHYKLDASSSLSLSISISQLPTDVSSQPFFISVTICGMRSEDLSVLFRHNKSSIDSVGKAPMKVDKSQASPAEIEALTAELEARTAKLTAATQSLKRAKREAPKTLAHWEAQLEAVRKSMDRNTAVEAKLESKRRHLEQAVGALRTSVQTLAEESTTSHVANADTSLPSSSLPDHQRALDEALRVLRAAEAEAREEREAHARAIRELDAERAKWKASLSKVAQETDPLEKALMDPLQRELRDVSRKFL
ncbi:hypothetical protein IWW38_003313, partial [Coemansia aciculifera]